MLRNVIFGRFDLFPNSEKSPPRGIFVALYGFGLQAIVVRRGSLVNVEWYRKLFFVRIILFLISRRAEDAVVSDSEPLKHVAVPAESKHEDINPTHSPQYGPEGDEAVTREEMMKLFGNALRVR
ncbi:MAG: hypothetical protein ABJJ53_06365 [Sulfitobacter sp.]